MGSNMGATESDMPLEIGLRIHTHSTQTYYYKINSIFRNICLASSNSIEVMIIIEFES